MTPAPRFRCSSARSTQRGALSHPLAARIAHGSPAFPLNGGWSCYVTDVDRSRFTITATRRDPETGEIVNREFVCAVLEVTE